MNSKLRSRVHRFLLNVWPCIASGGGRVYLPERGLHAPDGDAAAELVKRGVAERGEHEFTWTVRYQDERDVVYAEFDKVLYVAAKTFYKQKQQARQARAA